MKLPEGMLFTTNEFFRTDRNARIAFQDIVRDCAKVAINEDCDQTEYTCGTVLRIEKAILIRYGLEEQP